MPRVVIDNAPVAGERRRLSRRLFDALIVLCVAAVLAFPVVADSATSGLAQPPASLQAGLTQPVPGGQAPAVRQVPVLTPGGAADRAAQSQRLLTDRDAMTAQIHAAAVQLLGPEGAAQLRELLDQRSGIGVDYDFYGVTRDEETGEISPFAYPFRYPQVDELLDAYLPQDLGAPRLAQLNDLAALLALAEANFARNPLLYGLRGQEREPVAAVGGAVAYALLHRAAGVSDSCDVQLNLAFLVASAIVALDTPTRAEFREAAQRCPGDPTPLWLLGQYQAGRVVVDLEGNGIIRPAGEIAELMAEPLATFRLLQRDFPSAPWGWVGEGDVELRVALGLTEVLAQPFTARHHYRRALAAYEAADGVHDELGIDIGRARALAGLGLAGDAAAVLDDVARRAPGAVAVEQLRAEFHEQAHDYAAASDVWASMLAREVEVPSGRSLWGAAQPLSVGLTDTSTVWLLVVPPPEGGAGGSVIDLSFIPDYRSSGQYVFLDPWCTRVRLLRTLFLGQRFDDVIAEAEKPLDAFDSGRECDSWVGDVSLLLAMARAEERDAQTGLSWLMPRLSEDDFEPSGRYSGGEEAVVEDLFEQRQNLWRMAGNLARARDVTAEWMELQPDSALARDRAGEIAFLRGDEARAEAAFASAAGRWSERAALPKAQTLLKQATMQGRAGRLAEARATFAQAHQLAESTFAALVDEQDVDLADLALVAVHSQAQLGDLALHARDYPAAAAAYQLSQRWYARALKDANLILPTRGAVENNIALAQIQQGQGAEAMASARKALLADPRSPIYLQTLAFAQQTDGQTDAAVATYRDALAHDPTLFAAANDLGVLLAKAGREQEATEALRTAVGIKPDYALGWFNLGVLLREQGPSRFLETQGAFGRAAHADAGMRDREPELVFDADPYYTGLDVSRPLPPTWNFVEHQRRSPSALTFVLVGALLLRLLWGLGRDHLAGLAGERMFVWGSRKRRWGLSASWAPAVGVAATVLLFVAPVLWADRQAWPEAAALGAGVAVLTGVYLRSRAVVAASGEPVRHYTWAPALWFGSAMTVAGLGFAPLPVARTADARRVVRLAAPIALGVLTIVLLALGWWFGAPATRSLAATATVMVGSTLLPVKPLDGGYITSRSANLLIMLASLAVGGALLLGWI